MNFSSPDHSQKSVPSRAELNDTKFKRHPLSADSQDSVELARADFAPPLRIDHPFKLFGSSPASQDFKETPSFPQFPPDGMASLGTPILKPPSFSKKYSQGSQELTFFEPPNRSPGLATFKFAAAPLTVHQVVAWEDRQRQADSEARASQFTFGGPRSRPPSPESPN